jgi:hypothetical protein
MIKGMNHHFATCDLRNCTGFYMINSPLLSCFARISYLLANRFIEDYCDFFKI